MGSFTVGAKASDPTKSSIPIEAARDSSVTSGTVPTLAIPEVSVVGAAALMPPPGPIIASGPIPDRVPAAGAGVPVRLDRLVCVPEAFKGISPLKGFQPVP